jgi:hypothetical protein
MEWVRDIGIYDACWCNFQYHTIEKTGLAHGVAVIRACRSFFSWMFGYNDE